MGDDGTRNPLAATASGASQPTVEAFELLADETRLSILLALWDAYEPFSADNAVAFSELRDRVGIRQGAQFNYHLDKLLDRFVAKGEAGYELRRAGHQIVRSVIAGAGAEVPSAELQEIDIACPVCEAPTNIVYRDEWLYIVCTDCEGLYDGEDRPSGMLSGTEFDPAGLVDRTAGQQWRAGWLVAKTAMYLAVEGVCNDCSGEIDREIEVCPDHDTVGVCDSCSRQFAIVVRFRCPQCKNHHTTPPRTLVIHHPAVIAFYYERGLDLQYYDGTVERFRKRGELISSHDQEVVSEDPLRIRVEVEYDGDRLSLTLDEELAVVRTDREAIPE